MQQQRIEEQIKSLREIFKSKKQIVNQQVEQFDIAYQADKRRKKLLKQKQEFIDISNVNLREIKSQIKSLKSQLQVQQQPQQLNANQIYYDKFKRFEEKRYETNSSNLQDLYQLISEKSQPQKDHIILRIVQENKSRFIQLQDVFNYEQFDERIHEIFENDNENGGSDLQEKGYSMRDIDFSHFALKSYNISVQGSAQFLYPVIGVQQKHKKKCILNCFEHFGYNMNKYINFYDNYTSIDLINKIVQDLKIGIQFCYNTYEQVKDSKNREIINVTKNHELAHLITGKKNKICLYPVDIYTNLQKIGNMKNMKDINLIINLEQGHCEVLENNQNLSNNEDFYRTSSGQIINIKTKKKDTFKQAQKKVQNKIEDHFQTVLFCFDFETVFDPLKKNQLLSYSVSYYYYKNRQYFYGNYFGFDCEKKLINKIKEIQQDSIIILMGYNNNKFDNFQLVNELVENDMLSDMKIQNNQISKIIINQRHQTYDLCKILVCSLNQACQDFQIKNAKSSLDHNMIQDLYFNNKMFDFFGKQSHSYEFSNDEQEINFQFKDENDNLRNLIQYNILDCAAVFELYNKINETLKDKKIIINDLYNYSTIASIPHKNFKKDKFFFFDEKELEKNQLDNIPIQLPNKEQFLLAKESITAGRTQCFEQQQFLQNQDFIVEDVASLYPHAMMFNNNEYGIGRILNISFSECQQKKLIGFYRCTFDQKNLRYTIIPKREKNGSLNWNYKEEQTRFLSTIDINQLLKYKCNVKVENKDGFAREKKIQGSKLFSWLFQIAELKTEQDKFKETDKEKYNPILRNLYKLILNSQSGKFLFSKFIDQTLMISDGTQQKENDLIQKQNVDEKNIKLAYKITEEKYIINYKADLETQLKFKHNNLCCDIGVCIYAYSRKYMFDTIISKFNQEQNKNLNLYYGDTDSVTMLKSTWEVLKSQDKKIIDADEIKRQNKSYIKKFGDFEAEFYPTEINIFAPKNYFFFNKNNDKIIFKGGFKGVKIYKDSLINQNEIIDVLKMNQKQLFEFYKKQENKFISQIGKGKEIDQQVYQKLQQFITGMKEGRNQFVLCSSLKKQITDVKNTIIQGEVFENRCKKGLSLYQNFMIKEIITQQKQKNINNIKRDIKFENKTIEEHIKKIMKIKY